MRPVVVFGDVHGRSDQLELLIKEVRSRFGLDVDIYSLGDLIDRGPDSKGVIDICIREGIIANYGNHDQWLYEFCARRSFDPMCLHPSMAGGATISSYGVGWRSFYLKYSDNSDVHKAIANELWEKIPEDHKAFFVSMEPYRRVVVGDNEEVFWLIHAGLKESIARKHKAYSREKRRYLNDEEMMASMHINNFLWPFPKVGRNNGSDNGVVDLYRFENATQILGHTICKKPMMGDFFAAIDTGCGTAEPYTLSAIILPSREIIKVERP